MVFFLMFSIGYSFSQDQGNIILTDANIGTSFTKQVLVLEDKDHSISIESFLAIDDAEFYQLKNDNPTVQFTSSRFWVKFEIKNTSNFNNFYLETARPITDQVIFYQVEEGQVVRKLINGDDFNYYEKEIKHRKNLFSINLEKGESQHIVLEIISGGEGVILPVKIHDTKAFLEQDYKDQFKNGFYYGLVSLIIVIYFFFYLLLREISFLYYILYVFFQGFMEC